MAKLRPMSAAPLADALFQKRAVQFMDAADPLGRKAFPFFYSFIAYPYQQGNPDNIGDIYAVSAANAEGPDGIFCDIGQVVDIPVKFDDDYPFHLLGVRYSVRQDYGGIQASQVLCKPHTSLSGGTSFFDATAFQRVPVTQWVQVTVHLQSVSRDLYGGFQRNPITRVEQFQPINIGAVQGVDSGHCEIRTPAQLPAGAMVKVQATNISTDTPVRIYGHLYGYKILA